ncbi:arsenate-mycothiol transferase ArsC [Arenimonas alkanexedens]
MHRILFIGVDNAHRSQMAEGFARFHGGQAVEALSAGTAPADAIDTRALEVMAELGIEMDDQHCRSLDEVDGEFDAVVTIGAGDAGAAIPAKRHEAWPVKDPAGRSDDAYRAIRDDLRRRVQGLLQELRVRK